MFNLNPPKTPGQQGTPSGSVPPPPPPGVVTSSANVQMTTSSFLIPTAPKMGDIVQITSTKYSAWTGGKPKVYWCGLDDAALMEYESPHLLHPASVYSQQKVYNTHKVGLLEKIEKGGDVVAVQTNVLKHLQDTGMDAISYLPNPQDPTTMINVIENHSCYTQLLSEFDKYNLTNFNSCLLCLI